MEDKKFAVLIDGDNTSYKDIDTIINEVAKEGVVTYKRLYGDLTKPNLASWKNVLLKYSITPVQQYAYTSGKNSTDTAMIIDAMDILYTGKVDGFCIVSSDSDFTRLAVRLREAGMLVIGMGKQQTPEPFVKACSMFKFTDLIAATKNKDKQSVSAETSAQKESAITPIEEIENSVNTLLDENGDDDGWVLASTVGSFLQNKYNDFDSRNYGKKKMIDLLKELGFDTKVSSDKSTYFVSKRQEKNKKTSVKNK
ncbi:MAG: NYN domain-containing protein [Corallococcus sp.]|nr:NYN domain-containing protein [Bacillota bacterium]MCM1534015.1 NYN domain-containing protein [Corallococcus sp.]